MWEEPTQAHRSIHLSLAFHSALQRDFAWGGLMEIGSVITKPDPSVLLSNRSDKIPWQTFFLRLTHHVPPRLYIPPVSGTIIHAENLGVPEANCYLFLPLSLL